jgi:hypothetical protein
VSWLFVLLCFNVCTNIVSFWAQQQNFSTASPILEYIYTYMLFPLRNRSSVQSWQISQICTQWREKTNEMKMKTHSMKTVLIPDRGNRTFPGQGEPFFSFSCIYSSHPQQTVSYSFDTLFDLGTNLFHCVNIIISTNQPKVCMAMQFVSIWIDNTIHPLIHTHPSIHPSKGLWIQSCSFVSICLTWPLPKNFHFFFWSWC